MRSALCLVLLVSSLSSNLFAQKRPAQEFRLPAHAAYVPGRLLAKVKAGSSFSAKTISNTSFKSKRPYVRSINDLVPEATRKKNAARMAPRMYQPVIDISRYYSITYDPARNVEEVINDLMSSGDFEVVEPEYAQHMDYTPNDPQLSGQYYLNTIKALDAWGITQGDTAVTIAIVDSGGQLNHPDLAPNLYVNKAEYPPNGIDDDGNGFVDDYQGWDFVGSDTLNFQGDNNPNNSHSGVLGHGSRVAGIAGAATDNGTGMAGVGFHTKILFTKHAADNQNPNSPNLYAAYQGILYAANLGIKIINCSWGSASSSQLQIDIMKHVTQDLGALVVVSAGNNHADFLTFPAMDNNSISPAIVAVGATDPSDQIASFSNYGDFVTLYAPGVYILSIDGAGYTTANGTSFSAPLVAGAAALLWAARPSYSAVQIAEQLRLSADQQVQYMNYPNHYFAGTIMLGKGRLNVARALTDHLPSIRCTNPVLKPGLGGVDTLYFDFNNLLESSTAGLQIRISIPGADSIYATVLKAVSQPGIITGGTTIQNKSDPFLIRRGNNIPENSYPAVMVAYEDGSYSDGQLVTGPNLNSSFVNVEVNKIQTSIVNNGRIGFAGDGRYPGLGLIFNNHEMLSEMGLIMGSSSAQILDNVTNSRSTGHDQSFIPISKLAEQIPGGRSDDEVTGSFSNSTNQPDQKVVINFRSLAWKNPPNDKFIIMEYKLTNPTATTIKDYRFALYADWDIDDGNSSDFGEHDLAEWYAAERLGFVHSARDSLAPFGGIQLLRGTADYFAIENKPGIIGSPFGLYDGFTNSEKFNAISTQRLAAGFTTGSGADVSHVLSAGPFTIAPGETITIPFAILAASNLNDLVSSAKQADSLYNFYLSGPMPSANSIRVCHGSPATLSASGAAVMKWYSDISGNKLLFEGNPFVTDSLWRDTTFYVANADRATESVRTPVTVTQVGNSTITASGWGYYCEGDSVVLSVSPADSITWLSGSTPLAFGVTHITVSTSGPYTVIVVDTLSQCRSTSTINVTIFPKPHADFSVSGSPEPHLPVSFINKSSGADLFYWDFGDGSTSSKEYPQHIYSASSDYVVTLVVWSIAACSDRKTETISIVTEVEADSSGLDLYPNPVSQFIHFTLTSGNNSDASVKLTNVIGQLIFEQQYPSEQMSQGVSIPFNTAPSGVYLLTIQCGQQTVSRRVIKAE